MKLNNQNREELPLRTHDEQSGLDYILHGDYYVPEVTLPKADKVSIGHYGWLRLTYLQKYRPGLYSRLILSGKLYAHLKGIDQACHERLNAMVPQLAKTEGIGETLKARDQMAWVAGMNSIRNRVEESILSELVYE